MKVRTCVDGSRGNSKEFLIIWVMCWCNQGGRRKLGLNENGGSFKEPLRLQIRDPGHCTASDILTLTLWIDWCYLESSSVVGSETFSIMGGAFTSKTRGSRRFWLPVEWKSLSDCWNCSEMCFCRFLSGFNVIWRCWKAGMEWWFARNAFELYGMRLEVSVCISMMHCSLWSTAPYQTFIGGPWKSNGAAAGGKCRSLRGIGWQESNWMAKARHAAIRGFALQNEGFHSISPFSCTSFTLKLL